MSTGTVGPAVFSLLIVALVALGGLVASSFFASVAISVARVGWLLVLS